MWRCKDAIRKISLPRPSRKATQQLKPYFCCNLIFKNWPQTLSMRPLAFRALALWQKHVALCDLYREHYTTVYKAMLYLIWRPSHISNISSHLNRVWPNECIAVLCFAVIAPQPPSNPTLQCDMPTCKLRFESGEHSARHLFCPPLYCQIIDKCYWFSLWGIIMTNLYSFIFYLLGCSCHVTLGATSMFFLWCFPLCSHVKHINCDVFAQMWRYPPRGKHQLIISGHRNCIFL